jgi:hypothetical protein
VLVRIRLVVCLSVDWVIPHSTAMCADVRCLSGVPSVTLVKIPAFNEPHKDLVGAVSGDAFEFEDDRDSSSIDLN